MDFYKEEIKRRYDLLYTFLRRVDKTIHNYSTDNIEKLNEIAQHYKNIEIALKLIEIDFHKQKDTNP